MSHATEILEVCPYNPAHTILRSRMQTHLHKCRKNYPTAEMGYCAHNATHHLPRMELQYHETYLCPNRHSFQLGRYDLSQGETKLSHPVDQISMPEPEENWDDGQVNNFDPAKNAAEKSLIRGAHCVPPAARKAFKLQHRRNIQEREQELVAHGPVQVAPPRDEPSEEQSLRRPKELPKGFIPGGGSKVLTEAGQLSSPRSNGTPGVMQPGKWTGVGRGRGIGALTPSDAPPAPSANAWGRGRPKI